MRRCPTSSSRSDALELHPGSGRYELRYPARFADVYPGRWTAIGVPRQVHHAAFLERTAHLFISSSRHIRISFCSIITVSLTLDRMLIFVFNCLTCAAIQASAASRRQFLDANSVAVRTVHGTGCSNFLRAGLRPDGRAGCRFVSCCVMIFRIVRPQQPPRSMRSLPALCRLCVSDVRMLVATAEVSSDVPESDFGNIVISFASGLPSDNNAFDQSRPAGVIEYASVPVTSSRPEAISFSCRA